MMWKGIAIVSVALIAACSGDHREETRDAGPSGDADRSAAPSAQAAPSRSESFSRGTVPMIIVAKVAGASYRASGLGECASSADASIYEVPATLWHATYEGTEEPRHLNLTVWRPKAGGGDMVGVSLTVAETTHQIATVKGGRLVGEGTPGVRPSAQGGTLSVTGKDDHGDAIELSVECERFDEVVAEGG